MRGARTLHGEIVRDCKSTLRSTVTRTLSSCAALSKRLKKSCDWGGRYKGVASCLWSRLRLRAARSCRRGLVSNMAGWRTSRCTQLPDLAPPAQPIRSFGYIKMDAEGSERKVRRGTERTMQDGRPALLIERGERTDIEQFLSARRYRRCI